MTETEKKVFLSLEPAPDVDPEIGRALTALRETRNRTKLELKDLPAELVDSEPPNGSSSIGTILYHIALMEADWLFDDILHTQETGWPAELFPVDHRDDAGHLSVFAGESLDEHMSRLEKVRTMLVDHISAMSPTEFHERRVGAQYDVSAAWVLHHLMQHEAEHRSQIGAVREALGAARPG